MVEGAKILRPAISFPCLQPPEISQHLAFAVHERRRSVPDMAEQQRKQLAAQCRSGCSPGCDDADDGSHTGDVLSRCSDRVD